MNRHQRRAFYGVLLAGAAAGFCALVLVLASQISLNTHRADTTCGQVQRLERVIRAVLVQSYGALGAKGSAGYAYYLAHPLELAAARLLLRREIAQFTGWRC